MIPRATTNSSAARISSLVPDSRRAPLVTGSVEISVITFPSRVENASMTIAATSAKNAWM
jgi:hypothetical protein